MLPGGYPRQPLRLPVTSPPQVYGGLLGGLAPLTNIERRGVQGGGCSPRARLPGSNTRGARPLGHSTQHTKLRRIGGSRGDKVPPVTCNNIRAREEAGPACTLLQGAQPPVHQHSCSKKMRLIVTPGGLSPLYNSINICCKNTRPQHPSKLCLLQ